MLNPKLIYKLNFLSIIYENFKIIVEKPHTN